MDRLNSNKEETEKRLRKLKDRTIKMAQSSKETKINFKKKDQSFSDLVCKKKTFNICVIRFPEEEKVGGVENELKEVMNENFPNIDWESWVNPR